MIEMKKYIYGKPRLTEVKEKLAYDPNSKCKRKAVSLSELLETVGELPSYFKR